MPKMQMPIELFNKGAVVYIDFAYDDDPGKFKKRPAIVIDYNEIVQA